MPERSRDLFREAVVREATRTKLKAAPKLTREQRAAQHRMARERVDRGLKKHRTGVYYDIKILGGTPKDQGTRKRVPTGKMTPYHGERA